MSSNPFIDEINNYKQKYLQENGKNMFFKKSQKIDCAKEISQSFSLESMVDHTIYIIPDTNKVVFDYTVYKLYANTNNYEIIMNKVISSYDAILTLYPSIEIHVVLDTFSISAAERYKDAIRTFCDKCMTSKTTYSQLTDKIYIYYTPSMIESISSLLQPFISPSVRNRIIYYTKAESAERFQNLLS